MQDEYKKKHAKEKEEIDMAAIIKPNVFEVSVNKEEYEKINEARITKSFLEECLEVAKSLKKGNSNK